MKLVLGGHGFIGKHLLTKLNANHEDYLAPTEDELDIASPLPEMNQIDHVFHLAAKRDVRESWSDLPGYFLVNVHGTVNVLDVVLSVNFVLGLDDPTTVQYNLGDMNSDGVLNILDVILLVNEVIE